MKRPIILLGLIVFFGFFLRIIFLGSVPNGFTPDEASQAYTAYSLLKTGKDEWGISWPITSFRSFLDYKAPLQTYLMIPSIAVFGLNEFSARLPSAIFGTFAIIAIYLLASKLFGSKAGLLAAFFLAISPWHLQFSRTALEVNLTSFLFPLGLFLFLEGLGKPKKLIYTALLWGLSLYSYHAAKVFIPLFSLGLIILFWKDLIRLGSKIITPTLVFIVLATPLVLSSVFGSSAKRGSDLLITKLDIGQQDEIHNAIAYSPYRTPGFTIEKIFHNKALFVTKEFIQNYTSYFTPSFWFTEGGREITYSVIPGEGLLYLWELPLLILGLVGILKLKSSSSIKIILLWLLLAAVPAAITKEGYRPNRAGSYATLMEMISAFGFIYLQSVKKWPKLVSYCFFGLAVLLSLAYFETYFFSSAIKYPKSLSFGWRDAINSIVPIEDHYQTIQVEQGTEPQSFVAFYTKTPPSDFQLATKDWATQISDKNDIQYLDQLGDYSLGKFKFKGFSWPENKRLDTLYLSQSLNNLPKERHTVRLIKGADDKPVMEIFDFNK